VLTQNRPPSLLLGVDQQRKEIVCGHTIGSYTFAKTLEYKAKLGLTGNSGKEVTVIPPTEYQERFVSALEGYFLACPGASTPPLFVLFFSFVLLDNRQMVPLDGRKRQAD
jgi:hypothetical protein